MKIAICGKGGCGKSTTTTLLGKELARMGQNVLVIDSDESNFGLHRQLGVELPRDFTEYFGGKDRAFKTMMTSGILEQMKLSAFAKKFFSEDWTLSDIPEEYYEKKDGVMLMSSGKIHQANEGCACTMNSIIQQFIMHLQLREMETAILDMEAGIEHFGRGTDNSMDIILMIIDPTYESMQLAGKIGELARSIEKPILYILNKVTEDSRELMEGAVEDKNQIAAVIPQNKEILEAGMFGKELLIREREIRKLAVRLMGYGQMK